MASALPPPAHQPDLLSHTDPNGHSRTYAWEQHLLVGYTLATGRRFSNRYDRLLPTGRVTESLALDDGTGDRFDYNGRTTRVQDRLGRETVYVSNARQDIVAVHDAAGNVTRNAYDDEGRPEASTDAFGPHQHHHLRPPRQPHANGGRGGQRHQAGIQRAGPAHQADRRHGRRVVAAVRQARQPHRQHQPAGAHDAVRSGCPGPGHLHHRRAGQAQDTAVGRSRQPGFVHRLLGPHQPPSLRRAGAPPQQHGCAGPGNRLRVRRPRAVAASHAAGRRAAPVHLGRRRQPRPVCGSAWAAHRLEVQRRRRAPWSAWMH